MWDARQAIHTEDFPRCAHCGGIPVEHLWVVDGPTTITFVAQCHGETETAVVPVVVWNSSIPETIEFGPAFVGP